MPSTHPRCLASARDPRPTRPGLRVATAAAAGAALMLAAACGSDEQDDVNADGLDEVSVGLIPIVDVAPVYLGIEQGFFEEQGIDLQPQLAQGGAAIVPAVVSGENDFGFSNMTSLLVARSEGLPLQVVSAGSATTGDVEEDYSVVMVTEDSEIEDAADLEGVTVAVNTLNNIGDTTIRNVVAEAGGDPAEVEFVEMAFPDMPSALEEGRIDAAWMNEPFVTTGLQDGARVVAANYAGTHEELAAATYFATEELVASDPELVERFTEAMRTSAEYAEANPEEARAILGTYTEIDEEVAAELILPRWYGEVNEESVQLLSDLAAEHGLIDEALDATEVLP
jgi:NitT/TauT family transport system substrate-binding protein